MLNIMKVFIESVMHWAARNGHSDIIKKLMSVDGNIANVQEETEGTTALMIVSSLGNVDAIELLLMNDCNADINIRNNYGRTALLLAACSGHDACVQMLIDKGALIDAKDHNDDTALIHAASCGYELCVKVGQLKYNSFTLFAGVTRCQSRFGDEGNKRSYGINCSCNKWTS
jgi:ankyrin repeat protein